MDNLYRYQIRRTRKPEATNTIGNAMRNANDIIVIFRTK